MKGLILAALALVLVVVGSVIALHFYRGGKEFKLFLGVFPPRPRLYTCRPSGLAAPDLGVLPPSWQEASPRWISGTGS